MPEVQKQSIPRIAGPTGKFGLQSAREPKITVFSEVESLTASQPLSDDEKYELARLIQAVRNEGIKWTPDGLLLTQANMKKIANIRREAHKKMRQWIVCRDLAKYLSQFGQESGKLKLVGEIYCGTVKVIASK